jgi:hypothetical protein
MTWPNPPGPALGRQSGAVELKAGCEIRLKRDAKLDAPRDREHDKLRGAHAPSGAKPRPRVDATRSMKRPGSLSRPCPGVSGAQLGVG